jgi:exopolysaccharide biosynthesis polyprenyl glycosylphosphotransferase
MKIVGKKESLILVLGDLFFFFLSLWIALLVRHLELPSMEVFFEHLAPFSLLFIIWLLVFYIAGLYEKHTVILKNQLPNTLANTQLVNSGLAVIFFYFIPFFGITPKTVLFIYLAISFAFILGWRRYGYFFLGSGKVNNAVIIGTGDEMREIIDEVNQNPIYNLNFVSSVDLGRADAEIVWKEVVSRVYAEKVSIIVIDLANEKVEPVLPHLYNLIFSNIDFIDMHKVYENIFDRVPLSLLKYNWFLENISTQPRGVYDTLKRLMDISISSVLLVLSLVLYPFVFLAIKMDDGKELFSRQTRVGENNSLINLIKFRTMSMANDGGEWGKSVNEVTKVGRVLRNYRIDELPQLWNVLKGDMSLVGPRPEFQEAAKHYSEEIPYYNVRHLIRPGLSGWAQIYGEHPHHGTDVWKTKNKLSYDLYYIKNRSFLLDLKIALRTIKTLLSREGS